MGFSVNKLISGGIMTTYYCAVKCSHCRHKASPCREKRFISEQMLAKILSKLRELGCNSVHLEGGEPFLFPDELIRAVKQINESGIFLEHVLTNCSWYKNQKDTLTILKKLQKNGLRRLVLKVGPFQNESIPLKKVQNVAQAAEKIGLNILIWDIEFYSEVAAFDPSKTHTLKKYVKKYGDDYISQLAQRFNITFAGRSFSAYEKHLPKIKTHEILHKDKGCKEEMSALHHFHVDLDGNFSFPYTQGLSISVDHLGSDIDRNKYPFATLLHEQGINGLYKYAKTNYNFKAKDVYISKCHLCYEIRKFMVKENSIDSPDLRPKEYYQLD